MKNTKPPSLLLRFLKWFCRRDYHSDIEGDLLELYERRVETLGQKKANRKLLKDVFFLFRPGIWQIFNPSQTPNFMKLLKHNLIFSFRNFKRHRTSFLINIAGLSTGIASALLIFLWVNSELAVDKFHEKDERLYQVKLNFTSGDVIENSPHTPFPLSDALAKEIADVESAVWVLPSTLISEYLGGFKLSTEENKKITVLGQFAEKGFFNLFSYPFIQGKPENALVEPNSIAISESLAHRLFERKDHVIGKTIQWHLAGFDGQAKVSGVFENIPSNSTAQFDFVLSPDIMMGLAEIMGMAPDKWYNSTPYTYAALQPGVSQFQFNERIKKFLQTKNENSTSELMAIPYSSQYLYGNFENGVQTGGRIKYVEIFSAIAIIILIIACINFMNLSTAKASRRMKEVGVKKALGLSRKGLTFQFLTESVMITLLGSLIALFLVWSLLPQFNYLTGKYLTLELNVALGLKLIAAILAIGLFSGSYPALYLSRFHPISVLKGNSKGSLGELFIRKGLVIFQFSISIILISSVLVVYKQLSYIQNKNLGYSRDHVIFFPREGKVSEKEDLFLTQLSLMPGVINASTMGGSLSGHVSSTGGLKWEGRDPDLEIDFAQIPVNYNLIETLNMRMVEGRSFSKDFNESHSIIFNEKAIAIMGMDEPLGKTVRLWGDDYNIIGVTKDFHVESLYKNIMPAFIFLDPSETFTVMARIESGDEQKTISAIEDFYEEFNPGFPLVFKFMDDNYQSIYESEKRISILSRYFAGLAIFISCLGLLGLVGFTAERRTKEIGIRKILGLSELGIIRLITSDFMKLVLISVGIALPIGYLITKEWLEQFAYRINLDLWLFVYAGFSALLIAGIISIWQTLKIALINPAECLKDE